MAIHGQDSRWSATVSLELLLPIYLQPAGIICRYSFFIFCRFCVWYWGNNCGCEVSSYLLFVLVIGISNMTSAEGLVIKTALLLKFWKNSNASQLWSSIIFLHFISCFNVNLNAIKLPIRHWLTSLCRNNRAKPTMSVHPRRSQQYISLFDLSMTFLSLQSVRL